MKVTIESFDAGTDLITVEVVRDELYRVASYTVIGITNRYNPLLNRNLQYDSDKYEQLIKTHGYEPHSDTTQ